MRICVFLIAALVIHFNLVSAQNVVFERMDSSSRTNLKLEIRSDKSNYKVGDAIFISYKFTNLSSTVQRIMIKEYWGFPMGMRTAIANSSGLSICKFSSRHFFSSQLYTGKELNDFYKKIEPGGSIEGRLRLQDVPVLNDGLENLIPEGNYSVRIFHWDLISNVIKIKVKK